jgi:hypothetical protein
MLRFASVDETFLPQMETMDDFEEQQKWMDRRKSLAEAQQELVLALCYMVPEEESGDLEWTILEAHEPVAVMVRSWLEAASIKKNCDYVKANNFCGVSESISSLKPLDQRHGKDVASSSDIDSKSTQSIGHAGESANHESRKQHAISSDEIESTIEIDWWTALHVVRSIFHLVSAGWRIPQHETGEEIIGRCLAIMERGLLLRSNELKGYGTESNRLVREERLAASSSAMTVISILSTVASFGLVPINMQEPALKALVRLHLESSALETDVFELFPSDDSLAEEEKEEWNADHKTFLEQREDGKSDVVALYWVLLAHSNSVDVTISVFFNMMALEFDSIKNDGIVGISGRTSALRSARIAVDAVCGAMWGKPPDVPGIPNLRIHWYEFFCAMKAIASTLRDGLVEIDRTWNEFNGNHSERRNLVQASLSLLLEAIASLKHFIHEVLLRGEGLLAPDEFDVIVEVLDENIDKWLCMSGRTQAFATETSILLDIRSEVIALVGVLRDFFLQCVEFESSPFNIVVEDECRVKLYSIMLRKTAPYMHHEERSSLALAVLRSWAVTGFAIHRIDQWARTASYIITDVFSSFEVQSFGLYQGNVHAPLVRLEALKLIALKEEDERRLWDPELFESTEHLSPLEQSLHLREQYLALVNGSLLPPLMTLFGTKASNIHHVAVVIPPPLPSYAYRTVPINEDFYGDSAHLAETRLSIKADEHELRRFAVKLLGRLYRSGTGESYRSSLLKMMLTAAINTSMDDFRIPAKIQADKSDAEAQSLFTAKPQPSLQAIRELEKCLALPFGLAPNAHNCLPPVVDALCSVLIVYGGDSVKERNYYDESWLAVKRCLAIAAILPLSRLGVSYDKKLFLSKPQNMTGLVPEEIVLRLVGGPGEGEHNVEREDDEDISNPQVAPFITVADGHKHRDLKSRGTATRSTNETTFLSFITVFSSILATLHTNLESKAIRDELPSARTFNSTESTFIESLDSNFRALCYDALGAFVRDGVDFPFTKELVPILQVQVKDVSPTEVSARSRCASSVLEALSGRVDFAGERMETHHHHFDDIIRLLLDLCSSTESGDVLIGFQSLRGLITATSTNVHGAANLPHVVDVLLKRLMEETDIGDVTESLVSLLHEISCIRPTQGADFLSIPTLMKTIDAGFDMCMRRCCLSKREESEACRLLTARLVGNILNQLDINENEATRSMLLEKLMRRLLSLTDLEAYPETNRSCSMILCDLVAHKLISGNDESYVLDRPLGLSHHELLAKECDDIARFLSEELETGKEAPFSAWLCRNDTLVTFRLGSLTSRYRGWLEVLIRSPTRRIRRLIRLPNSISLDSPEIPSTLWKASSKRLGTETVSKFVASAQESARHFTEPSDEMRKAASVMKKFDQMFPQSSKILRSVDTVGADEASGNSNALNESATSIDEWLHLVLKDSASAQHVIDELGELGFSPHVLLSSNKRLGGIDVLSSSSLPVERLAFTSRLERAISILDRVPPFNTHKIALLFASDTYAKSMDASKPSLEDLLLSTTACSPKFLRFSEGIGKLVLTRHLKYFSGGLDTSGFDSDGKLSVVWIDRDDCFARTMALFHVVPLMPEGANNRKRHVGNDNVHIIFVEPDSMLDKRLRRKSSNKNVTSSVVSGQFGFVLIFVQSLTPQGLMKVTIRLRDGLEERLYTRLEPLVGEHVVSEAASPAFVRQTATAADMSCRIIMQDHLGLLNWEERQSQLSAMRRHTISKIRN